MGGAVAAMAGVIRLRLLNPQESAGGPIAETGSEDMMPRVECRGPRYSKGGSCKACEHSC